MMTNDVLPGITGTTEAPSRSWRSIGRLGTTVRLGEVAAAVAAHVPPGWVQPEDHVPLALALAEMVTGRDLSLTLAEMVTGRDLSLTLAGLITAEQGRQLDMTADATVLEFAETRAARLATPIAEAVRDAMNEHPPGCAAVDDGPGAAHRHRAAGHHEPVGAAACG